MECQEPEQTQVQAPLNLKREKRFGKGARERMAGEHEAEFSAYLRDQGWPSAGTNGLNNACDGPQYHDQKLWVCDRETDIGLGDLINSSSPPSGTRIYGLIDAVQLI